MSVSPPDQRLRVGAARQLAQRIFEAAGLPGADAAVVTDSLIQADLRGHSSHGLSRAHVYCERIDAGLVAKEPEIKILNETGAAFHLDGGHGMGAVVANRAMAMCIEKARSSGVAMCSLRAGTHFGIASYFTMQAVRQNMIGFACCNAPATMAPWGGVTPMLGTNPFSLAVPAQRHPPVVLDSSSSVVARGKINLAEIENRSIPLGWAIDTAGNPTTDASAALRGSVLPFGEHKGYGIALMIDILSGVLSGASTGPDVGQLWHNDDTRQNLGFCLLAIHIAAFCGLREFKQRIDRLIDEIKTSRLGPNTNEILVPGELEFRRERSNREHGIVVGPGVLRDLDELQRRYGLDQDLAADLR